MITGGSRKIRAVSQADAVSVRGPYGHVTVNLAWQIRCKFGAVHSSNRGEGGGGVARKGVRPTRAAAQDVGISGCRSRGLSFPPSFSPAAATHPASKARGRAYKESMLIKQD